MKESINHYSESWKKLLELAVFKQKSESLGMSKLLGYYIKDKMLALQLQADLYLFFNEKKKSKELYHKAAELYAQHSFNSKSLALLEHLKLL